MKYNFDIWGCDFNEMQDEFLMNINIRKCWKVIDGDNFLKI